VANTPIVGSHTGAMQALKAFARAQGARRLDDVDAFIDELFAQDVMDAFMIGCQSAVETANWTAEHWVNRLNPGAIGITSGPAGEHTQDHGHAWTTGRDAARAMLMHHAAYCGIELPTGWDQWVALDPRYQLARDAHGGAVRSWSDYGNGRWAADPRYFTAIMNRETAIRQHAGGAPAPVPEPTMPTPPIIDQPMVRPNFYPNRHGDSPKIIAIHIQQGINAGSWNWWNTGFDRRGNPIQASSTVMIGRDGGIVRVVPEEHAPWTNGDVINPTPRGQAIADQFGPDPNLYTLSIETEGFSNEPNDRGWARWPLPKTQLASIVWQVRDWMQRYGIPLEHVVRHADFNSSPDPNQTRTFCPGDELYAFVLNAIGGGGDIPDMTPRHAKPVVIDGFDGTADVTSPNGTLVHADKRTVTAAFDGTNVRQWAATDALLTRQPLTRGDTFQVLGWVNGEAINGEPRWWVTGSYSRVWVGATLEQPAAPPVPGPEAPDNPPMEDNAGPKIVNGIRFYTVGNDGNGREVTVTGNGDLHRFAANASAVVGTVTAGQKATAKYWVKGEDLAGEPIWWVLDGIDGPRLWAGITQEKPR